MGAQAKVGCVKLLDHVFEGRQQGVFTVIAVDSGAQTEGARFVIDKLADGDGDDFSELGINACALAEQLRIGKLPVAPKKVCAPRPLGFQSLVHVVVVVSCSYCLNVNEEYVS